MTFMPMMKLPEAFCRRLEEMLGAEYPAFSGALEQAPHTSIRNNPAKHLEGGEDLERVPWCPDGFYLPERPVFTLDPAFHAGAYYVQEASSMFISEAMRQLADLTQPLRVLDLCAAPGGKSTLLASLLNRDSLLITNEVIKGRLGVLRENLNKWGYPNVILSNHEAEDFGGLEGFFDVVLIDAPCSGEGLFRKDPKAALEWSPANVQLCSARQRKIVGHAAALLREGGVLLYSTCTYNPDENEQNAHWMAQSLGLEGCKLSIPEAWGIVEKSHGYQFFPHRVKGEGFYLACFRKVSGGTGKGKYLSVSSGLKKMNKKQQELIAPWLDAPDSFDYFEKHNGELVIFPAVLSEWMSQVDQVLKRKSSGLEPGVIKGKDFIPSHELALSTAISGALPHIDLDKTQALKYLKKEDFNKPEDSKAEGWALVRYEHLNLGWVKIMQNRMNNYLPKDWRIRMDIAPGIISLLLCLVLLAHSVKAQTSTFDTNDEGWRVAGDAQNGTSVPTYHATGGNPGGYLSATDQAIGGVWYWVAPDKFRHNHCDAYNHHFTFQLRQNNISDQFNTIDIIFEGNGINLVYNTSPNPDYDWTSYDILMREDAGWRINSLTGATPTQAQFQLALSNLTRIWIRGEFEHGADLGSLDNVNLASGLQLDLDADNSSGEIGNNYNGDSLCFSGTLPVSDSDLTFFTESGVDSLTIALINPLDNPLEYLSVAAVGPIQVIGNNSTAISLVNVGSTTNSEWLSTLQSILYHHDGNVPTQGVRVIQVIAHACASDTAYALLHVFSPVNAGMDGMLRICSSDAPVTLTSSLGGQPDAGGQWEPALSGGALLNPAIDPSGIYTYLALGPAVCGNDTAQVNVEVVFPPGPLLGADTILCRDSSLILNLGNYPFDQVVWQNGSMQPSFRVQSEGIYSVEVAMGECTFRDSIAITAITCRDCGVYAPNVFSPNEDGINDYFEVYPTCPALSYHVTVFDRWGTEVFESFDAGRNWDGRYKGVPAPVGVYVYVLEWDAESYGKVVHQFKSGDVTIVR